MRGKDAKRYLQYALGEWTRVALGMVLSFTSKDISMLSGVAIDRVEAFLAETSTTFGQQTQVLPAPVNFLHERPIVSYDSKYFCSVPHLLSWAIKTSFERVLSAGPKWNAYQKVRAAYLVDTGIGHFLKMLPGARTYQSLFYPLPTGQEAELDGLVLFDRYAFLIEGKAGALGAARRGGKEKIKTQLDALVGDAADQVVRADEYIRRTDKPTFRLKDGTNVVLDKGVHTERVLVTLTLDVLDIFTAEMYQMRDIGVVTTNDLPWCVALTDLRAISEIVARPFELTHYLRWRLAVIADPRVHGGKDELNWLAVYLKEGPERLKVHDGFTDLSFTSYTDSFDAYFLYEEGSRSVPAPRPCQPLPSPMSTILDAVAAEGKQQFTELCECLLDLTFSERTEFAQQLVALAFKEKQGRVCDLFVKGEHIAVKVTTSELSANDAINEAKVLRRTQGRKSLVVSLTSKPSWTVRVWSVAP